MKSFGEDYTLQLRGLVVQDSGGEISPSKASEDLTWINVGIGLTFILFDVGVATIFRLGIGLSLFIAALRCIGQLAVVATILQHVFVTQDPWLVGLICCVFLLS